MRFTGEVVSWGPTNGYGWVKPDQGGGDLFLHHTAVSAGGRPRLGDRVSYREKESPKGWMAVDVRIIG